MPRDTPLPATLSTIVVFFLSASATFADQILIPSNPVSPHGEFDHGLNETKNVVIPKNLKRMSGALAREFLIAHNKIRMEFGEPPLKWDKNLARYARRWGVKRTADCKMIHTYGPYGENLFWGGRDHWTASEAVESWASERENYNLQTNDCQPSQMCGHYTQMIWKDSLRLGCARVKCDTGGLLVICEYDPPGNYIDENPLGTL